MKLVVHNKVCELRLAANQTQADLALILAVSRQTIIAIERGNYAPSVLLALKVAAHFKQPVDAIFSLKPL